MTLEELRARNINWAVNQSSIACGIKCARKLLLRYIWGVQPKVPAFKKAATQGHLFHRLLQLGPAGVEEVRLGVRTQIDNLMQAVQQGLDLTGELYKAATSLNELFDKVLAMANIFWTRFPRPERLEVVGKEILIESTWQGMKIQGTIDEVCRNKETGEIWIRDAKTTSDPLSLALSGYQWGIQSRFYRLLVHDWLIAKEIGYTENVPSPLRGLILDIACVPGIKFCKKDIDFAAYIKRVGEWYDKQEDKEAMQSKGIMFTEPLMNEELVHALTKIHDLMNSAGGPDNAFCGAIRLASVDDFDRDITCTECKNYKRRCCYYELCSADENLWPGIIERDYEFRVPEH